MTRLMLRTRRSWLRLTSQQSKRETRYISLSLTKWLTPPHLAAISSISSSGPRSHRVFQRIKPSGRTFSSTYSILTKMKPITITIFCFQSSFWKPTSRLYKTWTSLIYVLLTASPPWPCSKDISWEERFFPKKIWGHIVWSSKQYRCRRLLKWL